MTDYATPGVQTADAAPVLTHGVDLSHHNTRVDFHALWDGGVRFVICKASEGTGFTDPMYRRYREQARAIGMLFGAYHYLLPGEAGHDQAQHFLRAADPADGDLVPTLDVEVNGAGIAEAAASAAAVIKRAVGRFPMIYSGNDFYRAYLTGVQHATGAPLWIARYGHAPDVACHIWQYSDAVHYPGNSPVDGDIYFGSPHDMAQRIMLRP